MTYRELFEKVKEKEQLDAEVVVWDYSNGPPSGCIYQPELEFTEPESRAEYARRLIQF